jgi:hypothetical protein
MLGRDTGWCEGHADKAVGEIDPLETYFETHELFESTMEAKPINVTRTEVYGLLRVLIKNRATIVSPFMCFDCLSIKCSLLAS